MSSGPKNVTNTTEVEPPSFLLPGLTTAVNASLADFGRQGVAGARPSSTPSGSFPRTDGGFSFGGGIPGTEGSFRGIPRPGAGINAPPGSSSGLLGQAGDLTSATLAGDFLSPSSNPFLASTFNRAADVTQNRLASEFAGSGRDLGASLPARSEQLQTLASNIFGGNFQAERDRQISAIGSAQGLDPINTLINRLAGITPGAGGVTTSQQPVHRDRFGQFLGAGLAGLQLAGFSDRRLKKNIQHIGYVNGYKWYSFDYVWGQSSEGVMSDEIPSKFVSTVEGFDLVNYGALLNG